MTSIPRRFTMFVVCVFLLCSVCVIPVEGHSGEIHSLPHTAVLDQDGEFHVSWNYNDSHIMFNLKVATLGYVALGFSPNGGMKGSDMVIAWVDDQSGTVTLQDRFAKDKVEPMIKTRQMSKLLAGSQNSSHTYVKFIRPLDPCDVDSFKITTDTIRLIWAYHAREPGIGGNLMYHGENRGVRSLFLLNPDRSPPQLPENITSVDVLNRNVLIPGDRDTTYWCESYEIPQFDRKHHVIKVEPVVQPGREAEVHHIVLFACKHNNDSSVGVSRPCYGQNMPQDWNACKSLIVAWAIGGGPFVLPAHVGLPLGEEDGPTLFLMETHYDNPRLKPGMRDSSGLRIILTPELRQYDAGLIDMGVSVWPSHAIPPYYEAFLSEGSCESSCLKKAMANRTEKINVFSVLLHSHLAGRKMRLRHFRDGVEKKPILEDNNYDFNLQEYRMLPEEVSLEKGDNTLVQCVYDTSDRTTVTYGGLATTDEMCIAFVMYYPRIPLSYCSTSPLPHLNIGFRGATAEKHFSQPLKENRNTCDAMNTERDTEEHHDTEQEEHPTCKLPAPTTDHDYHASPQGLQSRLDAAVREVQRLSEEVILLKRQRSLYTRLSNDPDLVQFYTGFRNYELLMTFYQSIEPTASNMTRYSQHRRLCSGETKISRLSFPHEDIPLVDQFLLVLRKLRVGSYDQELADQYNVSVSTISRLVITWVNFLYFVLGSQPLWPSKDQVQACMPDIFKEEYPNTRVILDCTEIRTQTPSSLVLNSEFYSHYKSHNTLKSLIGISPSGAVTFVSSVFPGSLSDKAITRISGILDLIEENDEIMVDKGFVIQDLLDPIGAKLVIPPFLTDKRSQFSATEVSSTQSIARLRIHVERAIRRVKCYHIFDKVIPITLAGTVNQMWSVCCLLTNFCGDLF